MVHRYLIYYFFVAVRTLVPVAAGWAMASVLPPAAALGILAVLAAALPTLGAAILRSTKVGEITWRNRLASWLLPFGWSLGNGQLRRTAIACGVIWFALGVAGVLLARSTDPAPAAPLTAPGWTSFALLAGWIVDGAALLYLLATLTKNFTLGSPNGRSLLKISGVVVALLVASVALHLGGYSTLAAIVAAGPPLALGVLYGGWMLLIVTAGRNARWN